MNFKTKPFAHQLDSFNLAKDKEYWGHFHEMGAGKTKIAIDTANYLYENNKITAVLVVAPNGIHTNWANKEVPAHSLIETTDYVWEGRPTSVKRKRVLATFLGEEGGFRWLYMNIEAIRTLTGFELAEQFCKENKTLMIVDESTIIKTPKAKQTKAAIYLGSLCHYRRVLTGTPITQGPLDFFSQCKFLGRNTIPYGSFTAFRNNFAKQRQVVLNSGKRFNQIVGYQNLEQLSEMVRPFSDRILKSECLDLPQKLYTTRSVALTAEQAKLYQSMRDLYIAQLEDETQTRGIITATNALTLMMKLQQIATGFIKDEEGQIHQIHNNRLEALGDVVSNFTGKAIIWCSFIQNIEAVVGFLKENYGEQSVVSYYGETSREERAQAIQKFQDDSNCRFFVSNKTGAEGITLTAAEYTIYYSNTYSLHTRLQSEDRNHRIGQTKNVLYTDFYCPNTVDEVILKALKSKADLAETILKDWKEII